ncbi:unnamed protein product, partial [Iphiclides podalirius]
MIIFEGVNFIRERSRGVLTRWVCGRKRRLQCIASLTTVDGEVIKRARPRKYHGLTEKQRKEELFTSLYFVSLVAETKVLEADEVIMIPTRSGKKFLLMLDGYTYSQVHYSTHWLCSSKATGCTARVRRLPEGPVLRVNTQHTHPPPNYIFKDGSYYKI